MNKPLTVLAVGLAMTVAGCGGTTDPATDVTPSSATLNAHVSCSGGAPTPCQYRFRYWKDGDRLPHQTDLTPDPGYEATLDDSPVADVVTGLSPNSNYHYALCGLGDGISALTCASTVDFHTPSLPQSEFVTPYGTALLYHRSPVSLRGVNFTNGSMIDPAGLNPDYENQTESDYQKVQDWGGNHVRFGLAYEQWAQDTSTGHARFYDWVDKHVAWARNHHLWLYPTLFMLPGGCYEGYVNTCPLWTSSSQQLQVAGFWVDFARHYAENPVILGYDLLSEPTPGTSGGDWPAFAQGLRNAIRNVDPHHLVIVEQDMTNYVISSQRLFADNVLYSAHYYAPIPFTHSDGVCSYPGFCNGAYWNRDHIFSLVRDGEDRQWWRSNNVPFLISEFGTHKNSGYASYIADEEDAFNAYGLNWTLFAYRGNAFALYGGYRGDDFSQPDWGLILATEQHMQGAVQPSFP